MVMGYFFGLILGNIVKAMGGKSPWWAVVIGVLMVLFLIWYIWG